MRESTLEDYRERMTRVLVHIQENLDGELPLAELARVARFSPFHFHRIFSGMVGESVKEHVRRLRLERAALRLRNTRWPVVRIAFEAGYETHEAFSRAFKAMCGHSPSRFRDLRGRSPSAATPSGVQVFGEGPRGAPILWPDENARESKKMKVEIRRFEPLRVAFLRHVGPYSEVAGTWDRALPRLGAKGFLGAGTMFLGLCHDDPDVTPADRLRYDACVTVDEGFVAEGDLGVQVVAGGEYAVTTHVGPYESLGDTYLRLFGEWMPRSGREPRSAPCVEIYLNDPDGTEPEDLLTEVCAPLESR